MMRKAGWRIGAAVFLLGGGILPGWGAAQDQIEKAKIFRDTYPIVNEADLDCSFFLLEEMSPLRIISAEGMDRMLFGADDEFWAGPGQGVREGLLFEIVASGPELPGSVPKTIRGTIGVRRGRAMVVRVEGDRFLARIVKSCSPAQPGDMLRPYEKRDVVVGKNPGLNGIFQGGEVLTGRIVYLNSGLRQIGPNDWALIDIGREMGLTVGQHLAVFGAPDKSGAAPLRANAVVIDTGRVTATIKILSAKDSVRADDLVQVR